MLMIFTVTDLLTMARDEHQLNRKQLVEFDNKFNAALAEGKIEDVYRLFFIVVGQAGSSVFCIQDKALRTAIAEELIRPRLDKINVYGQKNAPSNNDIQQLLAQTTLEPMAAWHPSTVLALSPQRSDDVAWIPTKEFPRARERFLREFFESYSTTAHHSK